VGGGVGLRADILNSPKASCFLYLCERASMSSSNRRFLAFLSACGIFASILAYVLSFSGALVDWVFPWVVPLGAGVFALGLSMLVVENSSSGRWTYSWKQFTRGMPSWVNRCYYSLQLIAGAHFVWMALQYGWGAPAILDGQYVLDSRGQILKVLTQAEYFTLRGVGLRTCATIMICLYFVPMVFWWFRRNDQAAGSDQVAG
jgi:hypothetical protein